MVGADVVGVFSWSAYLGPHAQRKRDRERGIEREKRNREGEVKEREERWVRK